MFLDSHMDIFDSLRSTFMLSFVVFVFSFLLAISPVNGAQSFPVYRVNQLDIGGSTYGSRNTKVNMEARVVNSGSATRKCIVTKLNEFSLAAYHHLVESNAGAIMILLPSDLDQLSADEQEQFINIEKLMLTEEIELPVYFAIETEEVVDIYSRIRSSANADMSVTATEALLNSVSSNGFQMNVHTSTSKPIEKYKTINLHGLLEGNGNAERLSTVMFVAHYDAMGIAPGLAKGADSNGSGVAALLELMRVFSRLFHSSSRPNYNLVFLLSGSGKLNYFGTKKWLEEMKDSNKFPYLNEVESVVCLDSIGGDVSKLYVHISKPPKAGSANANILESLKKVAAVQGLSVEIVHKKIFLGDPQLAWEHEQFAMNKLTGMTLSTFDSHRSPYRTSVLDSRSRVKAEHLTEKVQVIGEAICQHMFSVPSQNFSEASVNILSEDLAVQRSMVTAWLDLLTSESRSAQFLDSSSSVVNSLEQAFHRHLKSVGRTNYLCDKREPEFVLFDSMVETMHVYSVKPAIFDLLLAIIIAAYLGGIYLISLTYPTIAVTLMNKPK
ncbi:BOS complex subunit ncln-like [Watersipora subatra]|uniref:BOS complex subunit ncln-like n=1 Tax=Watersipora subatra TaxID=2589382 RepID=UPI00355C1DA4